MAGQPNKPLTVMGLVMVAMGAQYWFIPLGMLYLGWVLATKVILPDARAALGLVIIGPLLASSALMYNDYCDRRTDTGNPRKRWNLRFMNEVASPRVALAGSAALALAAVLLSWTLGAFFLACTLACIGLSLLYSHPLTRLKAKGGMDLMVNVLGIGIIIPLMGWSLSGRPEGDFPFLYLVPVALALASLYAPTTVADHDADHRAGIGSLAVTLGKNATMWLSVAFLLSYIGANSALAAFGYVVPWRAMLWLWPFQAAQVGVYVWFIRSHDRDSIVRGLAALSLMHTIGMGIFLLFYTGAIPI